MSFLRRQEPRRSPPPQRHSPPPQAEGAGLALPALLPGRRGPNSPQRPHSPTKDHLAASRTRQGESRGGFPPSGKGSGGCAPSSQKTFEGGRVGPPNAEHSPSPSRRAAAGEGDPLSFLRRQEPRRSPPPQRHSPTPQAEGAGLALPALLPGRRGPNSPQRPHSLRRTTSPRPELDRGSPEGGSPLWQGVWGMCPQLQNNNRGWAGGPTQRRTFPIPQQTPSGE